MDIVVAIVINDTAVITLDIESRSHNYLVAIDGRSERMTEETRTDSYL